jgi:hypothetical protein
MWRGRFLVATKLQISLIILWQIFWLYHRKLPNPWPPAMAPSSAVLTSSLLHCTCSSFCCTLSSSGHVHWSHTSSWLSRPLPLNTIWTEWVGPAIMKMVPCAPPARILTQLAWQSICGMCFTGPKDASSLPASSMTGPGGCGLWSHYTPCTLPTPQLVGGKERICWNGWWWYRSRGW